MSSKNIGKSERDSQNRIIQLFQNELHYTYLGNWEEQERAQPIEEQLLFDYLIKENINVFKNIDFPKEWIDKDSINNNSWESFKNSLINLEALVQKKI